MNDLFPRSDTDLNKPEQHSVTPYDAEFPIEMFINGLRRKMSEAEATARNLYEEIISDAPIADQIKKATTKSLQLVADLTEEELRKIDEGVVKLSFEKGREVFQYKDNNTYGAKIPVKREYLRREIDPTHMAMALQMKAMQELMQKIADQIQVVDQNVRSVLEGQQNDRLGLYYSGVSLYLESKHVIDEILKKELIAQALRSLSESSFQLSLSLKSDIQYLAEGRYNAEKKNRTKLIDEKISNIHRSFGFIHQSMILKAGVYCELGEMQAMTQVLSEYSYFLKNTIAANAQMLAECDKSDPGTKNGVWKQRANFALDIEAVEKQLNNPEKVIYLGYVEEGDEQD
ncbi:MAG: hypothetical protein IJ719_11945 [Clostridia bacterium]|nr:hypothetical protein [Clostridia bacterium]